MKKVFIVEDEALVALELRDHLRKMGYEVCGHAARGETALKKIPSVCPDLVLMDISLGDGMTGLEVAERLQGVYDVPVIFLTAYTDAELTERAGRSQSFAYIVKPFEPQVLQANLELALVRNDATIALRESEAFNIAVLDSLTAHVAVLDERGVIAAVNKAWREFPWLNGASPLVGHFIGANYFDVCTQSSALAGAAAVAPAAAAVSGIRAVLAGELPEFHLEHSCQSRDEQRWFLMHVTRLTGSRTGVVISHENVTARKKAENALRASEFRYRRLFEEALEGILDVAGDGTIVEVNPAFAQMLGYGSPADLVGTSHFRLYDDPTTGPRIQRTYRDAESIVGVEVAVRKADGDRLNVEIRGRVVRGEQGERLGFHGIVRDVTAHRQQETALRLLSTGLSRLSGNAFFDEVAMQLAALVGTEVGFVGVRRSGSTATIRTLGFAVDGKTTPAIEYPLAGTPCEQVFATERSLACPERARESFPGDGNLAALEIEAYVAAPLVSATGQVIGHIGIMARRPITQVERVESVVALFALRVEAELERQRSEQRFEGLFEFAPDAMLIANEEGQIVLANRMAEQMFGYNRDELFRLSVDDLVPPLDQERHAALRAAYQAKPAPRLMGTARSRLWVQHRDGVRLPVEISLSPLEMGGERLVAASIRDLTARVQLEEQRELLEAQLRQSQKMDSLGVLSAGIAHDFNNLLAVIAGGTELALAHGASSDLVTADLTRVTQATTRATELVNQILTFGRANASKHVPLSLRSVVDEAVAMLHATVPASIRIVTAIDSEVPAVVGDPTQIHQVLMNLGTNAWHALEDTKGTITIRLGGVLVSPADADVIGMPPGEFSRIQISDDGVGMDAATIGRVFEPFFTTKEPGKGVGLGLAVAYGIIADHGGAITVESAKGLGTTCSVYLPKAGLEPALQSPIEASCPHGSARVLVVDDEKLVGVVCGDLLESLGYAVTLCHQSLDALDLVRANPGGFDVLITDQSMPVMGGVELARNVTALRPDLPIILTSGYRHHTDVELKGANIRGFVSKPFTRKSLGAAVASALSPRRADDTPSAAAPDATLTPRVRTCERSG